MKSFIVLSITFLSLFLTVQTGCAQNSKKNKAAATTQTAPSVAANDKLEVIYFHSEHRCKTCVQIEKLTKETLEKAFANEMKNGSVYFTMYNADDPKNAKIAEKYAAYGSALFLTRHKNGQETKTDLTNFAFTNAFNDAVYVEKFKDYIKINRP
ncbi:MAG: nitrophenyl compound nitroreductase subunit ArsF family protein [Saprospiraceae bacterium]|nr:nitrophenyl compound nitroreductase subunit ArsF family protein [Saprospiraceae bacterium]